MNHHEIKGLVGGIQKFSTEDGPGIRTTVFLKGCPLDCRWCHNPELIDPKIQLMRCPNNCIGCGACVKACAQKAIILTEGELQFNWKKCDQCLKCIEACWSKALNTVGAWMTVAEVMKHVIQDKDFYLNTGGGMTISGGEMLSQPEFTEALLDAAWENGIGVALDTSGYGSRTSLIQLAGHRSCTHVLFDLKQMDREIHRKVTGVSNRMILENLQALAADSSIRSKIIIRIPLIAGMNDSNENVNDTCRLLIENGLKTATLLPYHELGVSKCRNIGSEPEIFQAPNEERTREILEIFKGCGISTEVLGEETDR